GLSENLVEWTAPDTAGRVMLGAGIADRVVFPIEIDGARIDELFRRMVKRKPSDIERPQIEARLFAHDPLGHHFGGAAPARYAICEPGADEGVIELRRLAHDELAVRGKWNRAIYELSHADLLDNRRALECGLRQDLEALEIAFEQLLAEFGRNAM